MIARTIIATAVGIAALTGTSTPAPDAGADTVTVFSENVNNLVTETADPTTARLATLHTHDVLELVSTTPTTAAWGDFWNVRLDDGRTGYISTKVTVPTPTTTEDDLTEASVIIAPSAGGGWLGQMAAGSSAAFTYPTTMSDKIAVPEVGTELTCADFEVTAKAGVLGDVAMTPCSLNGTIGYIRTEHIAPAVDLDTLAFSGAVTAVGDTPVYNAPAATDETEPVTLIPAGTKGIETGLPTGAFTPVRFDGETGWAPTKVLQGIETLSDRIKDRAGTLWEKTKEVAGETKDKLGEKLDNVEAPAAVTAVRDVPALILSGVLALLTLAMAWLRKVSIFKLGRNTRRALNLLSVIPLTILATVAPIASYGFLLWVVLGITAAVGIGVFTGFRPDLSRFAATIRTRKSQIILGGSVVVGALTGALVTGFSGWLPAVVTGALALTAALGYALSSPDETPIEDEPTPVDGSAETAPEEVSA